MFEQVLGFTRSRPLPERFWVQPYRQQYESAACEPKLWVLGHEQYPVYEITSFPCAPLFISVTVELNTSQVFLYTFHDVAAFV